MTESPYHYLQLSNNHHLRYGIWPVPEQDQKGTVLLLNGRSEFMEKYAEVIGALNARGMAVFSIDWRGQGLSSRFFANRMKGHIETYQQYIDDLAFFVDRILQPCGTAPSIIMAHSMGGHIALRYIKGASSYFSKAILISPMIDINAPYALKRIARPLIQGFVSMGLGERFCFGAGDYPQQHAQFAGNPLTSDPVRFGRACQAINTNPELGLGGVTFGWLSATFDSIDQVAQAGYARSIKIPILLVTAGQEKIVCSKAQDKLSHALPNCRHVRIPTARHEILMERDAIQQQFWQTFDTFIDA